MLILILHVLFKLPYHLTQIQAALTRAHTARIGPEITNAPPTLDICGCTAAKAAEYAHVSSN